MNEHPIRNLTSLSPAEELKARVAISAPGEDRLRLSLPAVVGTPGGRVVTIYPDHPTDADASAASEATPEREAICRPSPILAVCKRLNLITGPSGSGKTVFCKGQTEW